MATIPAVAEAQGQHYIPRFYLKGFTDKEGKLWVCEKFKPTRQSKPKDEAHRPDYYTSAKQGRRNEVVEDALQTIESRAAPVICKLANPMFRPTPEQMGFVYVFTAFMFVRVPSWREHLDKLFSKIMKEQQLARARDKEAFYKFHAQIEQRTGKRFDVDVERLRQHILKGEYEIKASHAYNLASMFQSAMNVAEELAQFSYEILYAPAGYFFVTCDSPVFTLEFKKPRTAVLGVGFGRPSTIVHFPLNKRACLRFRRGVAEKAVEISEYDLNQINRATMYNAKQYLYSSQGSRRLSRLFDQWGCKIVPGENAFMPTPEPVSVT